MCWKYELASAHNNLNWAIRHLKRAAEKLRARREAAGHAKTLEIIGDLAELQRGIRTLVDRYGIVRLLIYLGDWHKKQRSGN